MWSTFWRLQCQQSTKVGNLEEPLAFSYGLPGTRVSWSTRSLCSATSDKVKPHIRVDKVFKNQPPSKTWRLDHFIHRGITWKNCNAMLSSQAPAIPTSCKVQRSLRCSNERKCSSAFKSVKKLPASLCRVDRNIQIEIQSHAPPAARALGQDGVADLQLLSTV